jgi:predicted nucleotidyltransferase
MHAAKVDPPYWQAIRNPEAIERFNRTLFSALDALEEGKIPYALIGGIASSGLGRPRSTEDIDVFVRAEDGDAALEALKAHGFKTEKTDLAWLFKGFKEDILVDVIFKSRGDIYFDKEMDSRTMLIDYHGRHVRMVSPEDLIIIKCAVHDEVGPHHWHDALALLSHATLDWDYLLKRARKAPRRLLSLLLYAQSNDIWIPNRAVMELYRFVFGDLNYLGPTTAANAQTTAVPRPAEAVALPQPPHPLQARRPSDQYTIAHVRDALARDARTGQQGIKVIVEGNRILLRGEAPTDQILKAMAEVARDAAPGFQIDNQVKVQVLREAEGAEDVG